MAALGIMASTNTTATTVVTPLELNMSTAQAARIHLMARQQVAQVSRQVYSIGTPIEN